MGGRRGRELVTATESFRELSREQLENVLDMLDGRYPSDRFAELRPRIVWDRTAGTIHGRKGARQLVVTNAGTIPDRGLYGVHLPDGRRVGELDEEMVYEARPGQTFLLGASTWRIEEITRDRVIVTPAPARPGAVPFWRGDGIGRPAELGRAIGAFSREAVSREPEELAAEYDLDPRAAQQPRRLPARAAGGDPRRPLRRDDRGRALPRRDRRLAPLRPLALRRPRPRRLGPGALAEDPHRARPRGDAIWSDDGIVIHLPDADEPPPADLVLIEPDELEDLIVAELSGSALFGARFRENAARSLLIPRAYPGKRTPLWQQRLKSQSLLEVARDFPRFPVILETYRECLQDVLDLPALDELLRKLHSRQLTLVEVETPTASPFASSLLFDYVATYMYEGDTPNAERRAAALALDRDLLRELLGQEELRELIDPEALDEVEAQLQHRTEAGRAGDRDALQQILRNLGDLTAGRVRASGSPRATRPPRCWRSWSPSAASPRSGSPARSATSPPRTPASTATRSACRRPPGCRRPSSRTTPTRCATLVRRYARTHGPFPTAQLGRALRRSTRRPALRELEREGALVRGELLPGGTEREWCDSDVLRRVRRASLARLRREVEPADRRRARPLPAELAERRRLPRRRRRPRPPARGAGAAAGGGADAEGLGAATCCRAGSAPTRPAWLDELCTSGELVWIGAGAARPQRRPRRPLLPRGRRASPGRRRPTPSSSRPRARSTRRSASGSPPGPRFWLDLLADLDAPRRGAPQRPLGPRLGRRGDQRRLRAAAGAAAARGRQLASAAGRRFARRRCGAGAAVQGRWSLTAPLFADAPAAGARFRAQAELMLERYGIVTRETVLAEGVPGGFSTLYAELGNLELLGTARRGYFVEGLGGAQFALPGAVERLRSLPARGRLLPAARGDRPGQPLRRLAALAEARGRPPARPRAPGAHLLLRDGEPVVYVERGGRGILRLRELERRASWRRRCGALADAVAAGQLPKLAVEKLDGEAGDRLRPRGGADRRRLQPRPAQTDPCRVAGRSCA